MEYEESVALDDAPRRAMDDLRFVRATMERASGFTVVPGTALVGVGLVGLLAAADARFVLGASPGSDRWLAVWGTAAIVAATLGAWALRRKARLRGEAGAQVGRKLALGLGAPLVAGFL